MKKCARLIVVSVALLALLQVSGAALACDADRGSHWGQHHHRGAWVAGQFAEQADERVDQQGAMEVDGAAPPTVVLPTIPGTIRTLGVRVRGGSW